MSHEDFEEAGEALVVPKKKKLTVEKFFQQFNTLDSSNFGSWPLSVKITCWIFLFLLVCALGYFFAIKPKLDAIDQAHAEESTLLTQFREKDSKLRNLQQLQTQLQQMEASFTQQLQQLPKETEIPSLVEDINVTGVNSGLRFKNISLDSEVTQEFFIEQPISIEATGDYHAFGLFVSGIAQLPRIVTLHDFTVTAANAQDKKSDIPTVDYALKAKTYRYISTNDAVTPSVTASNATTAAPAPAATQEQAK